MKNKLKKTVWLILLCVIGNVCFDATLVPAVQAASMTSAQKAREKEKAKKAKEREKAQKAREKEKAKKAKQREKDEKARAKAKAKKRAQSTNQSSKAKSKQSDANASVAKLSYEEQLAAVEKWNAHVAEYMSRDISHSIDFWGQAGYSSLFTQTTYTAPAGNGNAIGYQQKALGWIGGGFGAGYQLRYKRFLLQTGAELQLYGSRNVLYSDDAKNPTIVREYATSTASPEGEKAGQVQYTYTNMRDQLMAGFVQIPVMAGMQFYNNKLYFLAGPKIGIGVIGSSKVTTDAACTISDPELVSDLANMSNHGLLSTTLASDKQKLNWGLNLAAAAEIGGYVDPRVRLALFAEYGVLNIYGSGIVVDGAEELPIASPKNGERIDAGWNQAVVSSMQTTAACDAKVNPFLVGVKATMLLELPRKTLQPMAIPKEPLPVLWAKVVNADTEQPVGGAGVNMISLTSGKTTNSTTNAKGLITSKLSGGDYLVKAAKQGFYPDSVTYTLSRSVQDTILLSLHPIPAPIIFTYCARVYAGDAHTPLEAEVKISDARTQQSLYAGTATEDGLFVTDLRAGRYLTSLRFPGYMPLDDTVQFVQDTLTFHMTKIKEGIRVKINNLFFATGKTYILPQSETALEDLSTFLLDNPSVNIKITGHTDSIGSDAANQTLSEGRAKSVRNELIKRGVAADRIAAEGKGESEPVDTNSTEEGRQNNRRVEFTIVSTGEEYIEQVK